MIISAGRNEIFDFALPMGVGLVDMSINLSAFLQARAMFGVCDRHRDNARKEAFDSQIYDLRSDKFADNPAALLYASKNPDKILNGLPDEIIFVGSAGLYKEGKIFEIYESLVAANVEISSLENKSYTPCETQISSIQICDKNLNAKVSHETIRVNSSNFITTDENLAFKLFDAGYFLENMEFFAVLKVAEKFKIPAKGIFVATNFCNSNAHSDFVKNHVRAKEFLIGYLKNKGII